MPCEIYRKYRIRGEVLARRMPAPFHVDTPDGRERGKAGDYLVMNADAAGSPHPDQWVGPRELFERIYEEI